MENEEIWKDIPGYGGYQASTLGRIRSLKFGKCKIIKLNYSNNTGYAKVTLFNNGKKMSKAVHKMIAITFLDHKPEESNLVIDHISGQKLDNRLCNLQELPIRENQHKSMNKTNNTSIYIGVSKATGKRNKSWVAKIGFNSKNIHLGYFKTPEEASAAYQEALTKINNELL